MLRHASWQASSQCKKKMDMHFEAKLNKPYVYVIIPIWPTPCLPKNLCHISCCMFDRYKRHLLAPDGKKKENRLKFIIRLTNKQEFYDRSTSQTNTQLLLWTSGTHTTDEQYGAASMMQKKVVPTPQTISILYHVLN